MGAFRFTKLKITIGYILLLAMLFFTLVFVYAKMVELSAVDNQQSLQTDSLITLLHEKDNNTLDVLRVLSEVNDSLLSASEIEEIIAEDPGIVQQRVQHRVITKRDSLITPRKKRGFFKRLAEVFSPSKKDSAVLVNTYIELAVDTILEPMELKDSLQHKIRIVSQKKGEQRRRAMHRTSTKYQRMNTLLTARMDSLIKEYEKSMVRQAWHDERQQQEVRKRSTNVIGAIAIGAVLLSALFLILIMRDISRRNRYRKQLENANKRAEDLLSAREKMMLTITHDFKSPLGSIMGYIELLFQINKDERQHVYLENMKSSSKHLLKLVSDLLEFHRLDLNKAEIKKIAFEPGHLFEEICVSFEPQIAAKGLNLKSYILPELSELYISDPFRIRQIVNNLLSNAVKFTKQGNIQLTATYENCRLSIMVEDTGKGMTPEDLERIFHEFTRLSSAQGEEGVGLGLSIVHKLVLLLDGTIDVQSTLGKGSKFTVVLPLFPVQQSIQNQDDSIKTGVSSTYAISNEQVNVDPAMLKKKILLIDDDKIQLSLTVAMLQQHNINVTCCDQLDVLIERLRSSTFDVLLTDIQMPAINGFDLVKLLRASNIAQARSIPIIAVTARSEINVEVLKANGFAGYLHKPFTVNELLAVLNFEESVIEDKSAVNIERPIDNHVLSLNFSALTIFSEDDSDAAKTIIYTFIEETEKSADLMLKGLLDGQVDSIANIAHKLIPLFTLIGAAEAVLLLKELELKRGQLLSEEISECTKNALQKIHLIIEEAQRYVCME